MKWPSPQSFLQTFLHCLWPQGINIFTHFLLQFSRNFYIMTKRWLKNMWVYKHVGIHSCVCFSCPPHERELVNDICETTNILLFCSYFQIPICQLENTRLKFKEERKINNSGEYNWLHKQFRLFSSFWFLQAYFYLCFITKAFLITWLFVKLRFNIWNLQPLFIDNIIDSSIYFSPLVKKWNEENLGVNEENTMDIEQWTTFIN